MSGKEDQEGQQEEDGKQRSKVSFLPLGLGFSLTHFFRWTLDCS
jgi:hypothetical protein